MCVSLVTFQTAYIPDELYKRVYDFCKRLLTFPHPYCTVGLSYTRQIKTERFIPGIISDLDILIEFKIWGDKRLAYVRTACLNSC